MAASSSNAKENVLPWFISILRTILPKLIIGKEGGVRERIGGFIFIHRLEQKGKVEGMTCTNSNF